MGPLVITQHHPQEGLFATRRDNVLLIANSLAGLLEHSGQRLDPDFPYPAVFYRLGPLKHLDQSGDRAHWSSSGRSRFPRSTARSLGLYCENFLIDIDGRLMDSEKPRERTFIDFADYRSRIHAATRSLIHNAPGYSPVTTLSSGYDSTAVAAVAAAVGCRRALGLRSARRHGDNALVDDSGAETAQRLGLDFKMYDRLDYLARTDLPEAEFLSTASDRRGRRHKQPGTGTPSLASLHRPLGRADVVRIVAAIDDPPAPPELSGSSMSDFRLRIDCIHVPLPYFGALQSPTTSALEDDPTMADYRVGGYYDRPSRAGWVKKQAFPAAALPVPRSPSASCSTTATDLPMRPPPSRRLRTSPARKVATLRSATGCQFGSASAPRSSLPIPFTPAAWCAALSSVASAPFTSMTSWARWFCAGPCPSWPALSRRVRSARSMNAGSTSSSQDGPLVAGTVTFVFSDIEGSTRLLNQLRDDYGQLLDDYYAIVGSAFERNGGAEVDRAGDGLFHSFTSARRAAAAAVEAQRAMADHGWPAGVVVRARMGLHTGEPVSSRTRYFGMDVHRAARIAAAGHGGQILLSQTTRDLVGSELPADSALTDLGQHWLKDLAEPEHLYQLSAEGLPRAFPPLRSLTTLPNNLPRNMSTFVGRQSDLTEVKQIIAQAPLVTLTGPGGVGKTRLALQLAAEMLDTFVDGAWLVELEALTDGSLVPQEVAVALGVAKESDADANEALLGHISQPRDAPRAGHVRAPHRVTARGSPTPAPGVPGPAHPGHQPRGARCRRRAALSGPVADPARGYAHRTRAAGG